MDHFAAQKFIAVNLTFVNHEVGVICVGVF